MSWLGDTLKGNFMAIRVVVACPHCGSTGTYQVGVSDGHSRVQCLSCRKGARVHMKKGEVYKVVRA